MKNFRRRVLNHFLPHHSNAYRPHLLGRNWLLFILAIVLATEGFLVASLVARQSGGSFLATVIASELIDLTNQERVQNSVPQLRENAELDAAALAKAKDMAAKGYFSHNGPDGKQPWAWIEGSGYDYEYAGENLAVRFIDSKEVADAWMASPTHRANIVKPVYREIGIGVADGIYKGAPATFVVQYFGTPAGQVLGAETAAPAPQPAPAQLNTVARDLSRVASNPRTGALWILGGLAALLVILIGLAFFFHIQLQSAELLLPGVAVAMVAIFFLAFNASFLTGTSAGQSAAGQLGLSIGGIELDPAGAQISR